MDKHRLHLPAIILMLFVLHLSYLSSYVSAAVDQVKVSVSLDANNATANPSTSPTGGSVTYEMEKVTPYEYSGDVSDLPLFSVTTRLSPKMYRPRLKLSRAEKMSVPPVVKELQSNISLAPMPSPILSFDGLSYSESCASPDCADLPPDANGDVGLNYYIQAVNDAFAIYDKTGKRLASFSENQLWSSSGSNPCNGNAQGDPVVVYDPLADRWILTNSAFAFKSGNETSPFYECIAVSKTNDPVAGGWWLYPLRMDTGGAGQPPVNTLNDYPKFGIWPDCLYMTANGLQTAFAGVMYASLSRADLESGATLTWSLGFLPYPPYNLSTVIPSTMRGTSSRALPPPGTPNYFVSESQTASAFEVSKFTAGPNCGGGGTLSAATNVSHAGYTAIPGVVVPQPNTTMKIDAIDDRLMQKVEYRKVGSAESLWVVHNVQNTGETVRPQWAQLDVTGGTIATTPVQQQIYAPDTTLYRWMGSLAVDKDGNMALGYSTSNGTSPNFPSIAYSGRLATDPLNSLSQTETQLIGGVGSQTNPCGVYDWQCYRWGDYTAMSVDPSDDCTFWYTNEYYNSQANGAIGNWQTRIGSFKFPSCGTTVCTPSAPTVSITPSSQTIAAGGSVNYNISIKNNDSISCTSTTFSLASSDTNSTNFNASTVSPASLAVSPGTSGTATLTVTAIAGQTSGTDSTSVTASASGHANGVSNAVTTTIGAAASTAFATNSGGGKYTDTSGNVYQADTDYSGGSAASTTAAITGTSDPTLYQTERYGNFSYNIPLANGNYSVTLKFAEIYWNAAGKRIFNVSMQGTQVITNLDVYAVAGKNAAYDLTIPAVVTNGTLNITFTSIVDNAKVSAIEITQGSTACTASAPTVSITPSSQTIAAGGSVNYNISIKNNDSISCTSTTFSLASSDTNSTNFNASTVSPASLAVSPGTSGTATLTVTAIAGQTSGTDSTSVTASASGHANGVSNAVTTTIGAAASTAFATNSGGGKYTDTSGNVYQADTDYSGGSAASMTAAITGTSDPTLYQTERYGNFSYNVPLANGNYSVTLKFAEIYWNAAGKRIFNVSMQGTQVITNLDVYAVAGKNAAYDLTIPAVVTNGTLNITFTSIVDNAKVSAIEITQGSTACTASAPTVSITPSSQTITAGGSVNYNISIKNNDSTSCTSTTFSLASSDTNSTNFNASTVSPASLAVSPGTSGTATLTVTAIAGQTSGTDSTSVTASASGHANGVSNAVTTTIGAAASTAFATNSGGGKYTDTSGNVYQADTDYSGGSAASTTAAITGTSDPTLYQTERYGNFSYNVPLPNGNYSVTLKFAEIYWNAAGKRIFNVSMQGTQVISNLDIFSKVGKNAAYDLTIPAAVTNGTLNITFTTVTDNAKVSAVEVMSQ